MTCELRYLLKTNSDHEVCTDQASLRELLIDLRAVADDLDLNFTAAKFEAETSAELFDESAFCPCI
jgi:hypothetical protein